MKIQMLKISEIKESFNPRSDFSAVPELAKSIASCGLLQPLVVRMGRIDGSDDLHPILVDGAQRLRALKKLEQKETQVMVIDAKNAEEAQMAANLMRSDLNLIERARGYERMVRLMPARYNSTVIAKTFGDKKANVERLISVAKKLPAALDADISAIMVAVDFEAIEMIAQVPLLLMEKVIKAVAKEKHYWRGMAKVCEQLDYGCDVLTTEKLVSAGRAFIVKSPNGGSTAWTADPTAHKEAKEAYEKKNKQAYGGAEKVQKEKSEKQKEAEKKERSRAKEKKLLAVKTLPDLLKKFLLEKPSISAIDALGLELCQRHLRSDTSRSLLLALGTDAKKVAGIGHMELPVAVWNAVKPFCKTTESVIMLAAFLNIKTWGDKSVEELWVEGLK